MITLIAVAFVLLLAAEMIGTATFLVIYLRTSDWSHTPVGRHLAAYSGALLGLYVVTFLSMFIHDLLMYLVVLGCHAAFAGVIWQRVYLVLKAQRQGDKA